MAFKIAGRFIAISDVKTVASSDPSKQPMKKRELYMDCTRFDGITGQQIGRENKILLELGGDQLLDKLEHTAIQKGDIISVDFDLVGNQYTDKATGKMRVFTAIRCFDLIVLRKAGQQVQLQPAAEQTAAPSYVSNHQPTGESPFPPADNAAPAAAPAGGGGAAGGTDANGDPLPF